MIYIPINGHNLGNLCATWSLAPAAFYPQRGFGFRQWELSQWNPFEHVLLGFTQVPELGAAADREGGIPFVLGVPEEWLEGVEREPFGDRGQVLFIGRTLQLLGPVSVFVRSMEEWKELRARTGKSLEAKFSRLLEDQVQLLHEVKEPRMVLGDLEKELTPPRARDLAAQLERDRARNKTYGAMLGLQVGVVAWLSPDARALLKAWKELKSTRRQLEQGRKDQTTRQLMDAAIVACTELLEKFQTSTEADDEALERAGWGGVPPEILEREGPYGTVREALFNQVPPSGLPLWRRMERLAGSGPGGTESIEEAFFRLFRDDASSLQAVRGLSWALGPDGTLGLQGTGLDHDQLLVFSGLIHYFLQRTDLSHPDRLQQERASVVKEIGLALGKVIPDWKAEGSPRDELLQVHQDMNVPIPQLDLREMKHPALQALAILMLRGHDIVRFREALDDLDVPDPLLPWGLWGAAFGLAGLPKTVTAAVLELEGYDVGRDLFQAVPELTKPEAIAPEAADEATEPEATEGADEPEADEEVNTKEWSGVEVDSNHGEPSDKRTQFLKVLQSHPSSVVQKFAKEIMTLYDSVPNNLMGEDGFPSAATQERKKWKGLGPKKLEEVLDLYRKIHNN